MRICLIICLSIAAHALPAAAQSDLRNQFQKCRLIESDAERLACFDAIGLDGPTANAPKAPAATADAKPAKAPKAEKEEFGAEDLRRYNADEDDEREQSITVALLEYGKNRRGKHFFVLDNGQVWRQTPADTDRFYIPKRDNVNVVIERGLFGGHFLKIEGKSRRIRVQRIK